MLHPVDWSLALPAYAAAFAFGYLLGSIPFGLVLTRLAGTQDIRAIGSGNIGATNVLRTGRKGLAAATLILDALKGTAAVPFRASQTSVAAAKSLRPVRSTLVAPILPEPIARISCVPASRVMMRPNGIVPAR